jgi:hypothetical protein
VGSHDGDNQFLTRRRRRSGHNVGMNDEQDDQTARQVTPGENWKRRMSISPRELLDMQQTSRQALAFMVSSTARASIAAVFDRQQEIEHAGELVETFASAWAQVGDKLQHAFGVLARSVPRNWDLIELEEGLDLATEGWPIVWVPRNDIVARLVHAGTDEERNQILVEESAQILDDVEHVLQEMASDEGGNILVGALLEAVAAGRHHLWIPCQVTTTTVLDTLVGAETLIKKIITDLDSMFEEDEITVVEMKIALILQALPGAFAQFWVKNGDPIPTDYNRNATVHRMSEVQLTQRNALFALLLTTSLLRELHEYGDAEITYSDRVIRAERTEAP